MKIGVFDSGLGGLFTMKALVSSLPEYDYVYLGDTKRLPYGSRSHAEIYEFLKQGIEYLFSQDCALVIVACNTASAQALRRIQQEYLPQTYPDRRVLGMIIPLVEECAPYARAGLIATEATVSSNTYVLEAQTRAPDTTIYSIAAPLLVPMIESGNDSDLPTALEKYLDYFKNKNIEALILGCTHYAIIEDAIEKLVPDVKIISQTHVIPTKTKKYLARHPEIELKLSKNSTQQFCVTDLTDHFQKMATNWFGKEITIESVVIKNTEQKLVEQ